MQDIILSMVDAFAPPSAQSNFVVFKSNQEAVPMAEGGKYFKKCKQYARDNNAYIVTGLMNIADFLCLCMFAPDGKVVGAQRALFLTRNNREHYKKPSNLALFDTPYGKIFLCVDSDIYNPEVQRYARLSGCEILINSQWIEPNEYSEHSFYTAGWGAAQTNNLMVVCANNNAIAVCAPFLATTDNTGFVVKPANSGFATFNVSRLNGLHSDYHSSHFNTALFAAHRNLL
ncbi:MAG: carbon-nitrogen hydrolase family protein [Hydrogenoanaerobacterium sp.]